MKKIPVASKLPIQLVAVTGHTKSGKAIMLKLISSFKKYEKITYEPFLEEVGRLNLLKKIDENSAIYLLRRIMLINMYYLSIGRQINLRKNDVSSIFSYQNPELYLKRSKLKEGNISLKLFLKAKTKLPIMIHDGLLFANLLFEAFPNMKIIEMEKNPIELAYSWIRKNYEGGFEKNLRSTTMTLKSKNKFFTYFIRNNINEYLKLNKFDKVIFALNELDKLKKKTFLKLEEKYKKKILKINHLYFVTNTDDAIKKVKIFLKAKKTFFSKTVLKQINCPRKFDKKEYLMKKNFLQKKLSKKYYKKLLHLETKFSKNYNE